VDGVAEQSYGGLRFAKSVLPTKPDSSDHGVMESWAHDMVHVAVGGASGNMKHPNTAARDPIFWLHHANLDRLWNRWLDNNAHRNPDVVTDKDRYDQKGEKPTKANYAGSITFFGRGDAQGHDKKNGFTQGFDVTKLVQRIRRAHNGTLPELDVTVVPHSTTGLSDADLEKQKIDIPISNITLNLVTADKK
jgi:hypothetical protein